MDTQKTCMWCSKPFITHKKTTLYCCHRCNSFAYKDAKRKEKIAQLEAIEQRKSIHRAKEEFDTPEWK